MFLMEEMDCGIPWNHRPCDDKHNDHDSKFHNALTLSAQPNNQP